ncbi:galactose oxidase [Gigaspora margarita]|uniref:Galactose oxidase n=1 Tax=Gigaspora margarita TaxID=4874 RepID=A0A8H4EPS5_GIGMA|nr:galactose oxidase [Gigaspora margarita]
MNKFQNLCIYVILCFTYSFVISQDIPEGRNQHSSALINDKLYFFGGVTQITNSSNEVFYIDLSSTFDIFTSPFKKVLLGMPVGDNLGTCVSSPDNSTIFLIGGRMTLTSTAVYKFDPINLQWTIPIINGFNDSFINRNEIKAVIDSKGKSYIFCGTDSKTGTNNVGGGNLAYEMSLFDTASLAWSTLTLPTDVLPRTDYTATLLPTGFIIYLGGYTKLTPSSAITRASFNDILIFDTKSLSWSNMTASGITIQPRYGHSAVLIKDGNIIIFGGASGSAQVYPDLAVLNTNIWIWSVPSISTVNAPPSLTYHTANLYKIYMIIAFGRETSQVITKPWIYSNNIYIFNTETYSWVSSLNEVSQGAPTKSDGTATNKGETSNNQGDSSTDNGNSSTYKIILYVVISIGCIAFLSGLFVCYKNYYKNRTKIEKNLMSEVSDLHDKERYSNRVI